jgi:hypothetical protein
MTTLHTLLTKLADPDQPVAPLRLQAAAILVLAGDRVTGALSTCERCDAQIYSPRGVTRWCSNACRVGAYRRREGEKRADRRAAEQTPL